MLYLQHGIRTSHSRQHRGPCALRFLSQEKYYPHQGKEQRRAKEVQTYLELRADWPLVRLPHPVFRRPDHQ